jgi:hypothetical protein
LAQVVLFENTSLSCRCVSWDYRFVFPGIIGVFLRTPLYHAGVFLGTTRVCFEGPTSAFIRTFLNHAVMLLWCKGVFLRTPLFMQVCFLALQVCVSWHHRCGAFFGTPLYHAGVFPGTTVAFMRTPLQRCVSWHYKGVFPGITGVFLRTPLYHACVFLGTTGAFLRTPLNNAGVFPDTLGVCFWAAQVHL